MECEMEWQPIETAPKDGTLVLLAGGEPDYEDPRVSTAYWDEPNGWVTAWSEGGHSCSGYNNPTHWMPPPPPPT